ncbi:MAG: VOC family protein [Pseudomonadota bacterium]
MAKQFAQLEHVNFTVPDADRTAEMLTRLFDWKIRWAGETPGWGRSIHVGTDEEYLAIFSPSEGAKVAEINKQRVGHLNHVGIVVSDLDTIEQRVKDAGYTPYSHADYEPGKRFYFDDENGIEFEVVSYD